MGIVSPAKPYLRWAVRCVRPTVLPRVFTFTSKGLLGMRGLREKRRPMPHKDPAARRAYNKAWCETNREAVRAYKKAWCETNRETKRAYNKAWYETNREAVRAYNKAWYETNRETKRAYNKAWCETDRKST